MRSRSYCAHYVVGIGSAMCLIGHGAFGIITKQIWCNYFGVFGIGEQSAFRWMPIVGIADIFLGITLIVYPMRIVAFWLIFWGLFTALLRPLSGEPFAEFVERAGNYGAPLILLMLANANTFKRGWFEKIEPGEISEKDSWLAITRSLRIIGFTLLLGHGWLNLMAKEGLINQYDALGFENPDQVAYIVGCFEVIGSLFILLKPVKHVVFALFIWKMVSECFYPAYGLLEWIERGGSYAVLLALWLIVRYDPLFDETDDDHNFIQ